MGNTATIVDDRFESMFDLDVQFEDREWQWNKLGDERQSIVTQVGCWTQYESSCCTHNHNAVSLCVG